MTIHGDASRRVSSDSNVFWRNQGTALIVGIRCVMSQAWTRRFKLSPLIG